MVIIKLLADKIEEELEDACSYAKSALKYKEEYPSVAKTFYDLSLDEMEHMSMLHGEVTKLIESYRREHGEPPEAMQIIYDYVHEKHMDKAAKVKIYQEQYKSY